MQLLGYKCHAMVAAATTQRELPRELPRRHGGMGMEAFRPRLPGAAKRADEQGAALLQLVASTPVEVCCVCDRGATRVCAIAGWSSSDSSSSESSIHSFIITHHTVSVPNSNIHPLLVLRIQQDFSTLSSAFPKLLGGIDLTRRLRVRAACASCVCELRVPVVAAQHLRQHSTVGVCGARTRDAIARSEY